MPVLPPGYRWHASRPPSAVPARPRPPRPPSPTPRYASPPRWGLTQRFAPPEDPAALAEKPARTALVEIALYTLATFLGLFAFAEASRYCLALYGVGHLVPEVVAAVSALMLSFAFWGSAVLALGAWGALGWWLWLERELAFTANHRADPRRWWEVLLLALAPVVNLVALGVLLTELLDEQTRGGRRDWRLQLRSWWTWWAAGHLAVVGLALWCLNRSAQARTEALLLGAVVGAVLVLLTLRTCRLLRTIESSRLPRSADGAEKPIRWVIAAAAPSGPATA